MAGLISVSYFLISCIFSLLFLILWGRILLRFYRISSLHPLAKTLYHLTNPLVRPFTYFFPHKINPRYDWSALAAIIFFEIIHFILLSFLFYNRLLPFYAMALYILGDLIIQPCNLLFYAVIARVILSWLYNKHPAYHPATDLIHLITNPLIAVGHKIIPNISGFDFAPLLVLIILKVITLFISASVMIF